MILYHYDPETREFLYISEARLSPKDLENKPPIITEDMYLVPSDCTKETLPKLIEGYTRCFIDDKWRYIEDHRGETFYNKATGQDIIIQTIGQIPPEFIKDKPPDTLMFPFWNCVTNTWEENSQVKKEYEIRQADIQAKNMLLDILANWNDIEDQINSIKTLDELKKFLLEKLLIIHKLYFKQN